MFSISVDFEQQGDFVVYLFVTVCLYVDVSENIRDRDSHLEWFF